MEEDGPNESPELPDEGETDYKARVEDLEKELQYAKAEIANIVQRSSRDRSEALKYGSSSLAKRLIPSIDLLSRAIDSAEADDGSDSVIEGVRLTLDGLRDSLESEGITMIESLGEPFDPTCMEAIATIPCPEEHEPGNVVEVIESGYMLHDRVLRASRVIVSEGDS